MKVFDVQQTGQEYLQTQIARSQQKFRYCKVSVHDVAKYRAIIRHDQRGRVESSGPGPILCLGTRNGREVDLFRVGFFCSWILRQAL